MNILFIILKLFPLILGTVQQIEAVAQIPKAGAAKLQLVTNTVAAAYNADPAASAAVPQEKMASIVESMTASIVSFFNLAGVFKKSS